MHAVHAGLKLFLKAVKELYSSTNLTSDFFALTFSCTRIRTVRISPFGAPDLVEILRAQVTPVALLTSREETEDHTF